MQNLIKALGFKQLGLLVGGVMLFGLFSQLANQTTTPTAVFQNIVAIATAIEQGQPIAQAHWNGGIVPYTWGGGHGSAPGPSRGTCGASYTGPQPCIDDQLNGVDCSGFVRWVYSIALGSDVFGGVGTTNMIKNSQLHQVTAAAAVPGDLVFFGSPVHHVGIYIGNGQMINALESRTNIRTDHLLSDLIGYYHYQGAPTATGGSLSVVGPPTVSAAFIDQVLAANNSPAQGSGQLFYNYGVQYGIDPVFALAFFKHESNFGTAGVALNTLSIGNSVCTSNTPPDMRYQSNGHCFQKYHNWAESIESWYRMIRNSYVGQRNVFTVDQIVPIYAPSSDGNNVSAYIADVQRNVAVWRSGNLKA